MTKTKITNTQIGDRIADAADVKGINISDLTRSIGADRGYVTRLLRNEITHPHKFLSKLADILEVTEEWLLTGAGQPVHQEQIFPVSGHYLKARILNNSDTPAFCRINFPVSFQPSAIDNWFFQTENGCFAKNTLIITEKEYTPGSGVFLGQDISSNEYVLVSKKDTIEGPQFFNKNETTRLIGKIILMTIWEGEKDVLQS